jgi:DNA-binding beta-propeller fold protein YncE
LIDIVDGGPVVVASLEVPGSVVGPPQAVWIAPDESWAIVTSATKAESGAIVADDRVSVIDLRAKPPMITQQTSAGAGATSVRVSPDGTLALICNRTQGTVSVYQVTERRLEKLTNLDFGAQSGPSGVVFAHDGRKALVTRNFDHQVSLLRIDGQAVTIDPRPLTVGLAPYTIDVTADGNYAVVANMGRGDGDSDTVSFIDLHVEPPRVVHTVSVGLSPEGIKLSPDGKFLAVAAQNGTTRPPDSPFLSDHGLLLVFALEAGPSLRQVASAPIGGWSQGVAFSRDGRLILAQNMVERTISVFAFDGKNLVARPPLCFDGVGPAAIATSWA